MVVPLPLALAVVAVPLPLALAVVPVVVAPEEVEAAVAAMVWEEAAADCQAEEGVAVVALVARAYASWLRAPSTTTRRRRRIYSS